MATTCTFDQRHGAHRKFRLLDAFPRRPATPVTNQISAGWENRPFPNLTLSAEVYFRQMRNIVHILNMECYMYHHSGYCTDTGRSRGLEIFAQ
ncbi:MAG: hypothetical protein LBC19_10835 [Tannerella sp.]|nr:hypothetical protein [Tannerella sp.]